MRVSISHMGVHLLHSWGIYVIFYVIFVPKYQFGEHGLTWWPVISFCFSAPHAVSFTTGNYVAGCPHDHRESYIWLLWVIRGLLQFWNRDKTKDIQLSSFRVTLWVDWNVLLVNLQVIFGNLSYPLQYQFKMKN